VSELRSDSGTSEMAAPLRFAVVVSRYHREITDRLCDGAIETLRRHGAGDDSVLVIPVPGAYELPMAARRVAFSGAVDAVICLGALIRGETYHFEVLANATAQALQNVAADSGIPVLFGVLTCDDLLQAQARCGGERGHKGQEAALAAIQMALLFSDDGEE